MNIYNELIKASETGKKQIALLLDPDKVALKSIESTLNLALECKVDYIFFGGSFLEKSTFETAISIIKKYSQLPLILFPGNHLQVSKLADAILFLSLVSGRNPDFLINQQVIAAPFIKDAKLEVIPTAYLLIDGGKLTTAHYMSQTLPIPSDKPHLAANTALAAKYLGMKVIYCDSGSGANKPVNQEIIAQVKALTQLPLIIGGGITNKQLAKQALTAGADLVVIGSIAEQNPQALIEIADTVKAF